MKKILLMGLLAGSFTLAKAQGGIPVWPLVTAEFDRYDPGSTTTTPHQYVDWLGGASLNIMTDPGAVSRNYGQTQAAFNDCGDLMFFVMHNGTNAANSLELFQEDGTPINFEFPGAIPAAPMNANRGDDEVQIVKRPGVPNQWYVIYSLDPAGAGNDQYQASQLAFSLLEVPSGSTVATYVASQKDVVLTAPPVGSPIGTTTGFTNRTYVHGKAVSRTSATSTQGHDLYIQRRIQGQNNFSVDRFEVTNAGILWSLNSGNVLGDWWNLMVAGSPIELDPTESRLAVMERDQNNDDQEVYVFDITAGTLSSAAVDMERISFDDLLIFPDAPNSGITGYTATPGMPGTYNDANGFGAITPGNYLSFLDRLERKISSIEFSPNGRYLYFTAGGYVQGSYGNLTYLGQIDLDAPFGGNYTVRLQVQECIGWDINVYGRQDLTGGATGLPWSNLSAPGITGDDDRARYDELQHIARVQSCIDGNLYFTKVNSDSLYVIPNPNLPLPVNLVPSRVDLSTVADPNLWTDGYVIYMPDQIDGYDYNDSQYEQATFVVNAVDCNGDCHFEDFLIVNSVSNTIAGTFTNDQCPDTFKLCLHIDSTYDIVTTYGVNYPGAFGTNATVNYPSGETFFDIYNPNLGIVCCTAQDDPLFTTVTSNINSATYWTEKIYIPDNTIITVSNAVLDITNVDVVFGICSGINFVDGASARINNSVLRPCSQNDTWRGLSFNTDDADDNTINESTFKNAEVALNFEKSSDAVISNNLFSNCNHGVRVNSNQNFNHPISGNRFVIDDFYPAYTNCYQFTDPLTSYGIRTSVTNLTGEVSHNDFVYAKGGTVIATFGIEQTRGGAYMSENTFTNYRNPITELSAVYPVGIDNNEIEYNLTFESASVSGRPAAAISIFSTNGPTVKVFGNEMSNNKSTGVSNGVYASESRHLITSTNYIKGFSTGVSLVGCSLTETTSNIITKSSRNGIYLEDSQRFTGDFITCNDITMLDFSGTGINVQNSSRRTNITSNCVKDSRSAIIVNTSTVTNIPYIRNNYLYNYTSYGIYSFNHNGNIGTSSNPGINTFWSNLNTAIDVSSNLVLAVGDNFGIANISGPVNVTLSSNRPFHSTASCGHQIYGDLSSDNLNTDLICDNQKSVAGQVFESEKYSILSDDYKSVIEGYENQYSVLNNLLSNYKNANEDFMMTLLSEFSLTDNQQEILKFQFYFKQHDYDKAILSLNKFSPQNQTEEDYYLISKIILENINADGLTDSYSMALKDLVNQESAYKNEAISILKRNGVHEDYIYDEAMTTNLTHNGSIAIKGEGLDFSVHPNPSNGLFNIDIISGEYINADDLKIYDVRGKLITSYDVNITLGRIIVDLNHIESGVYFAVLDMQNEMNQTIKLIKQ